MSNNIITITASELDQKVKQKQSFILNVIATWCSDCTEQGGNMQIFVKAMAAAELEVFNLIAQKEKRVFIDSQYETLINKLGGHGFPRTILIKDGAMMSADNVEVISEQALATLAIKFKSLISTH